MYNPDGSTFSEVWGMFFIILIPIALWFITRVIIVMRKLYLEQVRKSKPVQMAKPRRK